MIGFLVSEQMPVEPLVAFKCDANTASSYSWSREIYHLLSEVLYTIATAAGYNGIREILAIATTYLLEYL